MKLVMLSGGSGKRLWPMSNDSRSKQFLKVLDDEAGQSVSMLQRNWKLLQSFGLAEDTYICSSRAQREMIESQLGNVPFIEEPERRDTFPAIALATMYLADVVGCPDDEPLVVFPIDPMVDSAYFAHLSKLPRVLEDSGANLALMGVQPTEPTNKYGYIRVSPDAPGQAPWHIANGFVEKPDVETATQLISNGALWNCGVFCFRIGYLKQILRSLTYPIGFKDLSNTFSSMNKRSFDYEVVEQTDSIAVLPFSGNWKDLGTWEALSEEMTRPFVGKGTALACEGTHVVNELGIPLVAVGLRDAVIVATPDGILVSDKAHSGSIKDVVSTLSGRPMFEERRWGSYRVLDFQKLEDGTEVLTKSIELLPGKNISYQKHSKRSEVWTILQGRGELLLDNRLLEIQPGDVVRVYAEQWHAIRAIEKLTFIEVQRGNELVEEDIIRRFMTWDETMNHYRSIG